MASNNDVILEEIEALEAIMMEDLNVHHSESGTPDAIEVTVTPATAQNIEEQHVRVTLIISLPRGYPDESPAIKLRNPRGIDDNVLQVIRSECVHKCEEFLGMPVLYELIELAREKLTANNTPSCPCAICLFRFTDNDHFTKTLCFHYFHSNCLGRYILNCDETAAAEEKENQQQPLWVTREKREMLCPVCREPLNDELIGSDLMAYAPPEEGKLLRDFDPASSDIKNLQEKMMALYLHQKANGGIIDLEEEKNKFLISAAVTNVEPQEGQDLVEENQEDKNLSSQNKDSMQKQTKSNQQSTQSQNNAKHNGGNKHNSHHYGGRNDYAANTWWRGNKNRNARRGKSYNYASRQNHYHTLPPADSTQTKLSESKSTHREVEDRFQNKKAPKQSYSTQVKGRNGDVRKYESKKSLPNSELASEESGKYHGRNHYYKNSYQKKGTNGGPSKGAPPPGFSELERNSQSHATS